MPTALLGQAVGPRDTSASTADSLDELNIPDSQDGLAKRVSDLEKQLKKRDEDEKKKAAAAAKKFVARPFGRIHIDAGAFNQDAANIATVGNARNGVDIRRARLGCEGEGFDTFFYRFDVDFVTFDQQLATRPVIVDAYLDTQNLPYVGNVRAGHFREPFSLERLDSTNDLPFLERTAVVNTLTPFRNIGLMGFSWNEAQNLTWAYGVFDENTNEYGEDDKDATGLAFTGRGTWLAYYDEPAEGRYLFHLGGSYSYRHVGENHLRRFAQTPEIQFKEGTALRTPNFVDTGLLSVDNYSVMGVEALARLGSLAFQGEYICLAGNLTNGTNIFFQGAYLEATYWLTGENGNYDRKLGIDRAVTPLTNFFRVRTDSGIQTGSGAWEAAARISTIDLNDRAIRGGEMTDITLGLNWYYAVRSRVMFNYIHSFLDRNNLNSNADIVAMRYQFVF